MTKSLQKLIIPDILREWGVRRLRACDSNVKVVDELPDVDCIVCLVYLNTFRNNCIWVLLKRIVFYFYSNTFFGQYFVLYFK